MIRSKIATAFTFVTVSVLGAIALGTSAPEAHAQNPTPKMMCTQSCQKKMAESSGKCAKDTCKKPCPKEEEDESKVSDECKSCMKGCTGPILKELEACMKKC
ncbi:hypothetical protein [Pendulispora albinea]|uniref:Uncharacterized protein n=1 Tax=Pendulispora albinea TaxID=2741071 RepID=A0ABZ2MBS0_9BACT